MQDATGEEGEEDEAAMLDYGPVLFSLPVEIPARTLFFFQIQIERACIARSHGPPDAHSPRSALSAIVMPGCTRSRSSSR